MEPTIIHQIKVLHNESTGTNLLGHTLWFRRRHSPHVIETGLTASFLAERQGKCVSRLSGKVCVPDYSSSYSNYFANDLLALKG